MGMQYRGLTLPEILNSQYTHSLAEVIGGRETKPAMAFCATPRCLKETGQMVYRVKGLGRGVLRHSARRTTPCPSCQMPVFYATDYYLLKDNREREVALQADGGCRRRGADA